MVDNVFWTYSKQILWSTRTEKGAKESTLGRLIQEYFMEQAGFVTDLEEKI